jgi:ribonuclease P protein component
MRSSADFSAVTRSGRRARCGPLVMYLLEAAEATTVNSVRSTIPAHSPESARPVSLVGLVVGKSVGGSVVRHRVSRRLRAELTSRLDQVPGGARVVVRALPEAALASSAVLGRDVDRALMKLTGDARR